VIAVPSVKAPVLQILLENHELCKYAKISLHIHIIVDLNKNTGVMMNSFNKTEAAVFSCRLCFLRAFPFISLNPHMFTVFLRKQTLRVSAIGIYLL